jgi:amidase
VEEACPDLSGADDVFGTLRAWLFDATYSDLARRRPELLKESIRWNAEQGAKLTGADLARAEKAHTRLYERMVAFFDTFDVLLAPTTQVLPFPVELEYPTEIGGVPQENYLEWMRSCTILSPTGCPALSVPGGFTPDGLPVGLQIIGAPRADRRVLEVGHAFERATRFGERRPPL